VFEYFKLYLVVTSTEVQDLLRLWYVYLHEQPTTCLNVVT